MSSAEKAALLDALADLIAARVVEKLHAGDRDGLVAQDESPLGARRHCAAVRRHVAKGEAGAAIVGRRHLLSRELIDRELAKLSKKKTPKLRAAEAEDAEMDRMLASVGMERVAS